MSYTMFNLCIPDEGLLEPSVLPCLQKHPMPSASCLPPNICLVPAIPQSSMQKEEMALCSLGEKWDVKSWWNTKEKKDKHYQRRSYSTYNLQHPLFLNILTFANPYNSTMRAMHHHLSCSWEPSLQAKRWVTGAPQTASKSLLAASWSQTLQEGQRTLQGRPFFTLPYLWPRFTNSRQHDSEKWENASVGSRTRQGPLNISEMTRWRMQETLSRHQD